MSAATVFGVGGAGTGLDVLEFSVLTLSIIYGWILVSSFLRVLENFFFTTLGMNSRSTIHALIIFITLYLIFIATVWFVDELNIIPAAEGEAQISEAARGLITADNPTSASNIITQTFTNSNRTGMPIVINPVSYF